MIVVTGWKSRKTLGWQVLGAGCIVWSNPPSLSLKTCNGDELIERTLTYTSETWTLTKRDGKQLNIFERKVYRRILGPVYENKKENWRILTNKEIYASVKKPTIIETIRLNRLRWFGHVQRMEENRMPKRLLYMNLGTRMRGRQRNRWHDEVTGWKNSWWRRVVGKST